MARLTLQKVPHLLARPAASQPSVVRLGRLAWTPGQILSTGNTSASLSHRAAHVSPQVLWILELWMLPPTWWCSALFSVRHGHHPGALVREREAHCRLRLNLTGEPPAHCPS